uniref:Uncharacterized protein n=1 Tax=viral metagenome TaxID=1070528 RepID=A0A6M3IUW9_9ZZZZ
MPLTEKAHGLMGIVYRAKKEGKIPKNVRSKARVRKMMKQKSLSKDKLQEMLRAPIKR